MKIDRLAIVLILGGTVTVSSPVLAQTEGSGQQRQKTQQQSPPKQSGAKAQTLSTVIVTGTRASNRTAADSVSPIDILTPKELADTGAPSLAAALRQLLPSLNFPIQSLRDQSVGAMPAQMRGLSPGAVLVLINGKVMHHSAVENGNGFSNLGAPGGMSSPVDLNTIPMNAIARIEVLRDGAAAQYGSGAIAGVINIILKGGVGEYGSVFVNEGKYNAHNHTDGRTMRGGADGGIDLGERGWVHLSVGYLNQQVLNRAGADNRGTPDDPAHDTVDMIIGLPRELQRQFALNGQYDIAANATLYGFSILNSRDVRNSGSYRLVSGYQATSPGAAEIFPNGFLPHEQQAMVDSTNVLGVRGIAGGWHYDFSIDLGSSHWKLHTTNTLNYSLGASSPTHFYIGTLIYHNNVFNADLKRNFQVGLPGPLTVAWGLAYSREKFQEKHGGPASYFGSGAQVFPGFQPDDAVRTTRNDLAEYVELDAPLTQKLTTQLAARHERYSDFGSDVVWKAAARYEINPTVAVRGTASTGFLAPTLQQEWYQTTGNTFVNTASGIVLVTNHLFRVNQPAAIALGAEPLTAEKSRNYSVGLVLTPKAGPHVTLDGYRIAIRHRIIETGVLRGPAVEQYLTSIGLPFISGGSFYTNAIDTRTIGADLVASWPIQMKRSSLQFTLAGNWNKTEITFIKPNPPQLGLHGLVLPIIDRATAGGITDGTPRTKVLLSADWQNGGWSVHGQITRYGTWSFLNRAGQQYDQTFGARYVLDASANYRLGPWTFKLGGINIANTYPERNNARNTFHGTIVYPVASPFGFFGAFWYGEVKYSW